MNVASIAGGTAAAAVLSACWACRAWAGSQPFCPPRPSAEQPTHRMDRRERKCRAKGLREEIPQFLDLLAAGSTAGLSAEASFRRAVDCLRGPLGERLEEVMRSVDLGVPWRSALDGFVESVGEPDLSRLAAVLARTETLGVSLRDATRELAATVREARRASTLERARTAPVRMLFPLVFLILPAFLLLTVVPVLITTVRSIN